MSDTVEMALGMQDDWPEIVWSIIAEAQRRFVECNAAEDFCLQCTTSTVIVFGGTNRVVWSARLGYQLDLGYCTEEFKTLWGKMGL